MQWDRDLAKEFGVSRPHWGFAASPLVLDDILVLNLGVVLALEKETGETRWRSKQSYGDAYATPVGFQLGGRPVVAVFNGEGLAVLDRQTGMECVFHPWKTDYDINAATPVVFEDKVFLSSGYARGATLLKLSGDRAEVLWESKVMRNKVTGCVLLEKYLYGFDENALKCIDLDGRERWSVRGIGSGALTGSPGRLICISSKGELIVVEATPAEYRELSRTKVLEGGFFWTTPVLSAARIYCRSSSGELICRDHGNPDLDKKDSR